MDLLLAICQGAGLALAIGAGGALVPLFVVVMAHVGAGIDLDGTDYEFFASSWFVAVVFAANVVIFYATRAGGERYPLLALALATGALAFAASLAEEGETAVPGLLAGAALAGLAALLALSVLAGAGRRAGEQGGSLPLIAAAAGIAAAALVLFVPPTAIVLAAGLAVLAASRRRRSAEKYEGLRILR